jgi:hypothetical protein
MSKSFGRWSHLLRLAALLALAFITFLVATTLARPPSWNDVAWYRADSLQDIRALPMTYGGNESCESCHPRELEVLAGPGHWKLSCESCHGPLIDHVRDDEKVGTAIVVVESPRQCLNCHSEQINRPEDFPQYRYQHGERMVRRHKSRRGGRYCLDCHDPHAPEVPGPVI